MSVLQISMSHVSDPPKIDYTKAKIEDDYYEAHAGYSFNLTDKIKTFKRVISRLNMMANEQTSKPILNNQPATIVKS